MRLFLLFQAVLSGSGWAQTAPPLVSTPTLAWRGTAGPNLPGHVTFGDGVSADSQGNVYQAVGALDSTLFPLICPVGSVNKFDGNGVPTGGPLWPARFLGGQCGEVFRMALDPGGFIYAVGASVDPNTLDTKPVLEKYDFSGRLQWRRVFGSHDLGADVEFDAAHGLVYALTTTGIWFRFDGSGNLLFQKNETFPDSTSEAGEALTVDSASVSVLTESVGSGSTIATRVSRYSMSGDLIWTNRTVLSPLNAFGDTVFAMAEDHDGNLIVGLISEVNPMPQNSVPDFNLVRYNAQGQIISKITDPLPGEVRGVAADRADGFYGTGEDASAGNGFLTERYGPDGRLSWRIATSFEPPGAMALAMALDGAGSMYLSGSAGENGNGGLVSALAKYTQSQTTVTLNIALSPPSVFPSGISGSTAASQTQVLVRVVDSFNKGIPNQTVKLDAFPPIFGVSPEDELGGHSHDDNRPIGTFPGGKCAATSGNICIEAEMTCVTEGDGICRISGSKPVYAASAFGGKEQIDASLTNTPTVSTSTLLEVRVQDASGNPLELLPDNPAIYVKIGGTCSHHGPSDSGVPVSCTSPDNNHWGAPDVIAALPLIASDYAAQFPNLPLVKYNDISLPFGGLFDINGNWTSPHRSHRIGRSVDVRSNLPHPDGVPDVGIIFDKFKQIVRVKAPQARVQIHLGGTSNEHIHIAF